VLAIMTGGKARARTGNGWPAALLAITLGACAAQDTKIEENILPTDYKPKIVGRLAVQLDSLKGIRDAYIAEPALKPRGAFTRYIICMRFDAKDAQGQYQGNKEYAAFYYQGQLTQIVDASREMCDGALYRPFPELEKF
jgi:hypothetical protein